jgi:hypothetical protein
VRVDHDDRDRDCALLRDDQGARLAQRKHLVGGCERRDRERELLRAPGRAVDDRSLRAICRSIVRSNSPDSSPCAVNARRVIAAMVASATEPSNDSVTSTPLPATPPQPATLSAVRIETDPASQERTPAF